MSTGRRALRWGAAIGLAFLVGCARYEPLPLAQRPPLVASVAALSGVPPPGQRLQVSDVVRLALLNSPDLLATRAQRGVSQAQLLQAGLAPNPNLNGAILPLAAGIGDTTAWNMGLTYDIRALVTLRKRRAAASLQAQSVDATLLWQEWQIVGQARLLAIDIISGERTRARTKAVLYCTSRSRARASMLLPFTSLQNTATASR